MPQPDPDDPKIVEGLVAFDQPEQACDQEHDHEPTPCTMGSSDPEYERALFRWGCYQLSSSIQAERANPRIRFGRYREG